MLKKCISILVLFASILFQNNLYSQEVGISGFYQADRLFYKARPGIAISYSKRFSNIFSLEVEYGNQYINQSYSTSSMDFSTKVNAKIFMNNFSISPLISIVNNDKFTFKVGSKHSLFLLSGKEDVHSTEFYYSNDTTFSLIEKDYTRNLFEPYYSYSNEFKLRFKEVFIPQVSVILNLSIGYIFNGYRFSGCVIMPTDIFAPYGRIGLGVSYKFKK